jgi:hypothetical protein
MMQIERQRNLFDDNGESCITWFSSMAARASDGGAISLATIIEYEFAHFVKWV